MAINDEVLEPPAIFTVAGTVINVLLRVMVIVVADVAARLSDTMHVADPPEASAWGEHVKEDNCGVESNVTIAVLGMELSAVAVMIAV